MSTSAIKANMQVTKNSQMQIHTDGSLIQANALHTPTPLKGKRKNSAKSNMGASNTKTDQNSCTENQIEDNNYDSTGVCDGVSCPETKKWMEKYKKINQRFILIEKELKELRELKGVKDAKEVRSHVQHFYKVEAINQADTRKMQIQLETLSNVVIRLEQKLCNSEEALVKIQAQSMRRNLIISGIEEASDEDSGSLMLKIDEFIKDKLQVAAEVPLKTYHRLGYVDGSGYRPVLIKLADLDKKVLLLSNASNLKGL